MVALLSASSLLRPLLDGGVRPVRVVDRTGRSWHLCDASGRVVACLVPAGSWRLPYSFVVDALPPADACMSVGDGALVLDGRRLQPARWWRPARPLVTSLRVVAGAVDALSAQWRDDLGRGPGLTPYADDVMCGTLVTLAAAGAAADLRELIAGNDLERRTTAISAALLRLACAGWCIDELAGYLTTLDADAARQNADAGPNPDVAESRRRLLAVGHTSGRGLARGVDAALGGRHGEAAA
jgi:hypothetical protein